MTQYLLQISLAGLAQGSLFALAALGLVVIYNASTVVNFAHGAMGMAATYVAYVLITAMHMPFAVAFLGAIASAFVLGVVVQKLLLSRLQGAPVVVAARRRSSPRSWAGCGLGALDCGCPRQPPTRPPHPPPNTARW